MSPDSTRTHLIAYNLRRVARVWSILIWILALILVFGTRNGQTSNDLVNDPLDILVPIFLIFSLVGLGIAFRWEAWGVLINIGFYLAIPLLYWLLNREWIHFSIMVGLSPVILPGVLFAAAWFLSRK